MFNALVVEKDEETGKTSAAVQQISFDDLPEGGVTVAVEYSTLNYKDGLCIGPGGGLVRKHRRRCLLFRYPIQDHELASLQPLQRLR